MHILTFIASLLSITILHGKEIRSLRVASEVKDALNHVPDWLKEYVQWHDVQRRNNLYSSETKYLTVACFRDSFCGGFSDRLRPLPYFLLFAQKTNRVLFIKWQKFNLEDFLIPPPGGLDWTLPKDIDIGIGPADAQSLELENLLSDPKHKLHKKKNLIIQANRDMYSFVRKSHFLTNDRPHGTFGDIWKVLFQPVPELELLIRKTMKDLNLVPKQYISAHFRSRDIAFSSKDTAVEEMELQWKQDNESKFDIENAIGCVHAVSKYQNFPIYFTASNTNDVKYALRYSKYANKKKEESSEGVQLIGLENAIRFHSAKISKDHKFEDDDEDYRLVFPAFVDLYLLANSACVSFGKLGFGRLGGYISGEECMIDSRRGKCKMQR